MDTFKQQFGSLTLRELRNVTVSRLEECTKTFSGRHLFLARAFIFAKPLCNDITSMTVSQFVDNVTNPDTKYEFVESICDKQKTFLASLIRGKAIRSTKMNKDVIMAKMSQLNSAANHYKDLRELCLIKEKYPGITVREYSPLHKYNSGTRFMNVINEILFSERADPDVLDQNLEVVLSYLLSERLSDIALNEYVRKHEKAQQQILESK